MVFSILILVILILVFELRLARTKEKQDNDLYKCYRELNKLLEAVRKNGNCFRRHL